MATRCSPFADLRKRAYVHSFTWTGSRTLFLAALPSRMGGKKKRKRMSRAFSSRIHLGAYLRAPSQDAFPLVPFSLARGKKGRPEGFPLFSLMAHTCASFELVSLPCILGERERAPTRLGSLSLFSSYLRAGYFFAREPLLRGPIWNKSYLRLFLLLFRLFG